MYMKKNNELFKTIWEHKEKKKKKGEDGRGEILPCFKPCPFGKGINYTHLNKV